MLPQQFRPALIGSGMMWICLLAAAAPALAQHPPNPPIITSPTAADSVSPDDVHMETGPMSDPDPLDLLASADWEIRLEPSGALVWLEYSSSAPHAVHTHLGDGVFTGPYSGRTALENATSYRVRVRHQDSTGLWSSWSELVFVTVEAQTISPLTLNSVPSGEPISLVDLEGAPVFLPDGPVPGRIDLEAVGPGGIGAPVAALVGTGGVVDSTLTYPALALHRPLRITVSGGGGALTLPDCVLKLPRPGSSRTDVVLPATALAVGDTVRWWISADGVAWPAAAADTAPVFLTPASWAPVPWVGRQDGFCVEPVVTGLQLPMALAFLNNPGSNPTDPYLYVAELYGNIRLIYRDGSISTYASGLLNFNPTGDFPGSGEQGLGGMCVDPVTGDLFVTLLYDAAPPAGPHYPRVIRLHSLDGGRTAASISVVKDMAGETTSESHYISNISVGPDSRLYVHMGDGLDPSTALDMNRYGGKILRMNQDGSAPSDNPFYNASDGITATDYIFTRGYRNPFGGVWRKSDSVQFEVENGTSVNDRLARVDRGSSYGWNGVDDSLTLGAIYNWSPTHAPVNVACVEPGVFGGSGFPDSRYGHLFVTESGPTYASGPQSRGKRIVEFDVDGSGTLVSGPTPLVEYVGHGRGTALGLAAGPDGLYFTDLYADHGTILTPADAGANVYRIRYVGTAPCEPDFVLSRPVGLPPSGAQFLDLNPTGGVNSRVWDFGDGAAGSGLSPVHVYTQPGLFDVKLSLTGAGGTAGTVRHRAFSADGTRRGLRAEYFRGMNFEHKTFERTEPGVYDDFGLLSPGPGVAADSFSVRWSGRIVPAYSETYTLHVISDDGARLWVNNQLLVNRWVPQSLTDWAGSISLTAGVPADFRLEFFEQSGAATCQLLWQSVSQSLEPVPGSRCFWTDSSQIAAGPTVSAEPRLRVVDGSPARGRVTLEYSIPAAGTGTLRVYDVRGRVVADLARGGLPWSAVRRVRFGGPGTPSGVYFARLSWTGGEITRKLILIR